MACNLYNDKIDDAVIPAMGLEVFQTSHWFMMILWIMLCKKELTYSA